MTVCGLLAGAGLAASLATLVLATEFGAMISAIVHVTDPVAYLSSLLVIVIACLFALVKTVRQRGESEFTNYRKFTVDTQSSFVPPRVKP